MNPILWILAGTVALVLTVDIAVHVDLIRTARRARRVQRELNDPGR